MNEIPGRRRKGVAPRPLLGCGAALLLLAACSPSNRVRHEWDEAVSRGPSDWPNISTNMMVEKYGPPDRLETLRLVWEHRGPWKKIAVWDELGMLDAMGYAGNIEGTIMYSVPADKRLALSEFNRGLFVSEDGTELSARSTGEDQDFLMLNLADEIVRGLLSPADARAVYARTIRLSKSGKASPSMQRLLFQ